MKTFYKTLLVLLFILLCNNSIAQNANTMGTDFWVAFMDNIDTVPRSQCLSVFAAAERACTLTISNPNTGWTQSMTVSPTTNNRLFVPLAQGYTTLSGQVTNTGFHVTSTDTISLYTITLGNPSVEYTCVLPSSMLGFDYMVQSFPADRYSSEFTIVATDSNTIVDIQLGGNTINGHSTEQTITVSFPYAGQAYPLKSAIPGDLSGTRITARGGKKIAVFHGDACVYIPNWSTGQSCDHVVEQAIPTEYWGREFIVPASRSLRADYVRVTALDNNCSVILNGNPVTTLTSGGTYQYTMSSTSAIDHIQTSSPALVNIYFPSLNGSGNGDPSMTTIAPVEQSMNHCRFPIITTTNISQHYAHIVCLSSSVDNIRVDGNTISSSFQNIQNAPNYSYARITLQQGIHNITTSDTSRYIAYITGFGNRVSYGYCLGYACRNLTRTQVDLFANGFNTDLTPQGLDHCAGDSIIFSIQSPDSILHLHWLINGTVHASSPLRYCFRDTGTYSVCAIVNSLHLDNTTIFRDTLCTTVRIHPHHQIHINDTCVESRLPYRLSTHLYYTDTTDTIRFHTIHGCDSTINLSLKVWYNDTASFDTLICDTLLPYSWHGIIFQSDSSLTFRLTNQHGADSIVSYILSTIICRPDTHFFDTTVCDTLLPFSWHGITFHSDSSAIFHFHGIDGTDSFVVYSLYSTICRPPLPDDSLYIWVPNVFTPGRDNNNQFRILCSEAVTEATVVIYQHWGDFVIRFDGLTESWDGTYKGTPCQQGTYVYLVTYKVGNSSRKMENLFGSITLLR